MNAHGSIDKSKIKVIGLSNSKCFGVNSIFMKAVRIGMGRSEVDNKTSNFPANQIVTNS